MEQDKQNIQSKKWFYNSMLISSSIFFLFSEFEKNANHVNIYGYTSMWLATILCLILTGYECIQLAKADAKIYNNIEFQELFNECIKTGSENNEFDKDKVDVIIFYFFQLLRNDKKKLIKDLQLMTSNILTEKFEFNGIEESVQSNCQNINFDHSLSEYGIQLSNKKKLLCQLLLKKFNGIIKTSFI